jgi:hypothetical protein
MASVSWVPRGADPCALQRNIKLCRGHDEYAEDIQTKTNLNIRVQYDANQPAAAVGGGTRCRRCEKSRRHGREVTTPGKERLRRQRGRRPLPARARRAGSGRTNPVQARILEQCRDAEAVIGAARSHRGEPASAERDTDVFRSPGHGARSGRPRRGARACAGLGSDRSGARTSRTKRGERALDRATGDATSLRRWPRTAIRV